MINRTIPLRSDIQIDDEEAQNLVPRDAETLTRQHDGAPTNNNKRLFLADHQSLRAKLDPMKRFIFTPENVENV